MAAEGPGRGERSGDADDIDARFDEIVAGLRSEQEASSRRRAAALRQAEIQRRDRERRARESQNRPLEGFDHPNPWPPVRGGAGSEVSEGSDGAPAEPTSRSDRAPGVNPAPVQPSNPPGPPAGRHRPHQQPPEHTPAPDSSQHSSPEPAEGPSWRGWEETEDEGHFIPPTPSLPAGDLHLWAIVVGLLGGPILLILSEVFHVLRQGWWTPLGIVLSVAGVVLLVLRLPKNRDYTDSSGGAQV